MIMALFGANIFDQLGEINTEKSLISMFFAQCLGTYKVIMPSFLIYSAWVWLYFVGLHAVRVTVFLFDVDKHPVRSTGIVGAAVLTGCYGLYTTTVGTMTVGQSYH